MAPNSSWYFAYGSNLSREQFRSRATQIIEEINGQLKNYELRFNKKVRGGSATANVQQAAGKTVHGVLYRIPESSFRNLDRYEGVPEHYRRIELRVTAADGRELSAQVYIASKVEKGLRPTPHYLKSILDGAAEHGMPAEYVAAVRAEAGAREVSSES